MTVLFMSQLIGVLTLVQSYEYLVLQSHLKATWSQEALNRELPSWLTVLFAPAGLQTANYARLLAGLSLLFWPHPAGAVVLLVLHILTMIRFLGTFNGGSDYMTLILLISLTTLLCYPPATHLMLWYLAAQLCLSYFLAGFYKLRNRYWRTGAALQLFLPSRQYEANSLATRIASQHARTASVFILIFELAFPISLFSKQIALAFIACGLLFHFFNMYFFGLNRFFWAWLAAYPALYYCAL